MNEAVIPGADILLAFDTSTPLGSVAVAVSAGTDVLARAELRKQGAHSSELLPKIRETLDEGGVELSEVSGLVVGAGPGSFTGVRVAAATAKGLAQALEIPLWPISSLEAGAAAVDAPGVPLSDGPRAELSKDQRDLPRYVLFDARSDRVYAACYLPTDKGLEELISPHSTTIGEILSGDAPMSVFVGDGAARHADEIRGAGFSVLAEPLGMPTADGLLTVLRKGPARAPLDDVARWEPDYLRPSSAERLSTRSS
jgi:N6-L-threonylcarbamoyladenine synthase